MTSSWTSGSAGDVLSTALRDDHSSVLTAGKVATAFVALAFIVDLALVAATGLLVINAFFPLLLPETLQSRMPFIVIAAFAFGIASTIFAFLAWVVYLGMWQQFLHRVGLASSPGKYMAGWFLTIIASITTLANAILMFTTRQTLTAK